LAGRGVASCLSQLAIELVRSFLYRIHSSDCDSQPAAGYRNCNNGGGLYNVGSNGNCWSSSPYSSSSTNAGNLNFNSSGVNPQNNNNRAHGFSVRCVQHLRSRFLCVL
jgi:hypothetical protein